MTTDLKAVSYVLFNNYDYRKSQVRTYMSRQLYGDGAFSGL